MAKKSKKITDIDLSITKKKEFRIDGDDNRIILLNTSDVSILPRLKEAYGKLETLSTKATVLSKQDMDEAVDTLKEMDIEMRELMNYIFDSNVSDACAPDGSMYDLFNGEFRFEHILTVLLSLYEENIDNEFEAMKNRVDKYTSKYTSKYTGK